MPFLTYTINTNLIDKIEISKKNNIEKFINRIEHLNYNSRAILVNKKEDVLKELRQKYLNFCNKITSGEEHALSETLINLTRTLNDSILCNTNSTEDDIKIDFEKDLDNEIDKDLFHKFDKDVFHPSLFKNSIKNFEDNFLNKIKTFIISKNTDKKKINSFFIFHKETAKYLTGYSGPKPKTAVSNKDIKIRLNDPNEHYTYSENVMKIKNGTNVLLNWWKEMPNKFRPDKFIFLTDTPLRLSKTHKSNFEARDLMENFLFEGLDLKKFDAKLKFLDPYDLRKQWWKHKRHFVFGKESSLIIDSEFGIEFVDENDPSKINNINKFVVIKDDENVHAKDISQEIEKIA